MVAVLVREHVRLDEGTARPAELALQDVVEEGRVQVDGLIVRAVERADVGGAPPQPVPIPPVNVSTFFSGSNAVPDWSGRVSVQ